MPRKYWVLPSGSHLPQGEQQAKFGKKTEKKKFQGKKQKTFGRGGEGDLLQGVFGGGTPSYREYVKNVRRSQKEKKKILEKISNKKKSKKGRMGTS